VLQNIIDEVGDETFNNKDLNRALLQAVQSCSSLKKNEVIECIRILLNAGANVDAEDPQDGKTALMIACEKGYIEIVDCLIQQEAYVNLKDRKQRSPILHALEANAENPDVVMQLIKKGAEVNVTSLDGWSPLLKATQK
jgi:ankyrin repeat protein